MIQHVREKFSCRACEAITQPPAPSHPIARGRAGPKLLAHVLFAKYGLHLPLNRQSDVYEREGIDLDVSTLADWVGAAAATLMPLVDVIRAHVFAAERIHADDTTVPVLAKGKIRVGRLWTYVRDDRPFAGPDPPAAVFFYSRDRGGEHPEEHLAGYAGLMQADAYAGFTRLYEADRKAGPIIEAACWAHARRKFFELADIEQGADRHRGGQAHRCPVRHRARDQRPPSEQRLRVRQERRPLMANSRLGCANKRAAVLEERHRQSDRLQPEALAGLHALPRRRPDLHDQQRRGAGAARHRRRAPQLDLRRLGRRRPPRRRNLHADRDREAQRRRSPQLGSPTCWPPRRSSAKRIHELLPWNWQLEHRVAV